MVKTETKSNKIAIIYYNAGLGHLREALCVKDILKSNNYNSDLIDFNEAAEGFYANIGNIYEKMQKNGLSKVLSMAWWRNPPDFLVKYANKIEREKEKQATKSFEKYLVKKKVDFVITTHFFAAGALAFSKIYKGKTINICVDNMWKNSAWVYSVPGIKTIVPTEESFRNVYLNGIFGLKKKDIVLAGHPFPPDLIKEKMNMHKRRLKKYNSDSALNILVTTGGAGTNEREMSQILEGGKDIVKSGNVNLVLWCNHHSWMKEKLQEKANRFGLSRCNNLKIICTKTKIDAIYGLHDQIKDADLLVTKPGELAMYGGLTPLYLFEPTSSQEYSLADFAYELKCALPVKKIRAKNIIGYADSHRRELKRLAENGLKNPLLGMQEKDVLLKEIRKSMLA